MFIIWKSLSDAVVHADHSLTDRMNSTKVGKQHPSGSVFNQTHNLHESPLDHVYSVYTSNKKIL